MGLPQREGLASVIVLWGKNPQTTKQTKNQTKKTRTTSAATTNKMPP